MGCRSSDRPIERFFFEELNGVTRLKQIKKSKLALKWIEEFESLLAIQLFGTVENYCC